MAMSYLFITKILKYISSINAQGYTFFFIPTDYFNYIQNEDNIKIFLKF